MIKGQLVLVKSGSSLIVAFSLLYVLALSAGAEPSDRVKDLLQVYSHDCRQVSYPDFEAQRSVTGDEAEDLFQAVRRNPNQLHHLNGFDRFPERQDVYLFLSEHLDLLNDWGQVWLRRRSPFLLDQLAEYAGRGDQDDLRALIRISPRRALDVVQNLPRGSCLWYAAQAELHPDRPEARIKLQEIATNGNAPPKDRTQACRTLGGLTWPGQEQYMHILWADSTLANLYEDGHSFAPLNEWVESDPQRWGALLLKWLDDPNEMIRQQVRESLYTLAAILPRSETLRPLLDGIKDPDSRHWHVVMEALEHCPMPEALPDLLWLAEHKSGSQDRLIETLLAYPLDTVTPALRHLQPVSRQVHEALRARGVIRTADEFKALDDRAHGFSTDLAGRERSERLADHLTSLLAPSGELVSKVEMRINELWPKEPLVAAELQGLLAKWHSSKIDAYIVSKLETDQVGVPLLRELPWRHATLLNVGRETFSRLAGLGGEKAGFAAYLLDSDALRRQILVSNDQPAQNALLAMARLDRTPLPVDLVVALRSRPEVEAAASAYLIANDSPEARQALAGTGHIVGNSRGWVASESPKWEGRFLQTLREDPNVQEIYAILMWQHHPRESPVILYVDNRGSGRVWTQPHYGYVERNANPGPKWRTLTPEQVSDFKEHLADLKADELPYFGGLRLISMEDYEYIHLTRRDGVRVNFGPPDSSMPHYEVLESFRALSRE